MGFTLKGLVLAAITCVVWLGLESCAPTAATDSQPVVLCTIFSYFDAARSIAKDTGVKVILPLPPRVSPHEYDASPADKADAVKTSLYIKNGLMLDDRFDKLVEGSAAKRIVIADHISKGLLLHTQEVSLDATAKEAHEDSSMGNPHIWLDPEVQIRAAEVIRDGLIDLDPAEKTAFEKNAAAYIGRLNKLNDDFKAATAEFKTKDFIGFHSAYDYLAHRYGLRQIASIEEIPGEGLNPAQAEKIIGLIKEKGIHYIAVETGLNARGLDLIQTKTGVKTITLQPLETYDSLNDTYDSLMRQNLESLKTALAGS